MRGAGGGHDATKTRWGHEWGKTVDLVELLKTRLSSRELLLMVRTIHDAYRPFLPDRELWSLLHQALPSEVFTDEILRLSGHQVINEILMRFYHGEEVIKYYLARERIPQRNAITAFEIGVLNSRVDLGTINDRSYAYEIKTALDSLAKLPRQLADYSTVFEFVTVVAHERHCPHILSSIPEHCGIRSYHHTADGIRFSLVRKATRSPLLHAMSQIRCLTSQELRGLLRETGVKPIGNTRQQRLDTVLAHVPDRRINALFKQTLKRRYDKPWRFLTDHFDEIHPIDVQTFFSLNIDPRILYYPEFGIANP